MSTPSHRNRLIDATSPYLRQHAHNPVDWYPWGAEALDQARRDNKPILLSIGYSACHWCHVMAHESFEDAATAALMNALFINIKVDREERPDLDRIYQTAFQLLHRRSGGWPLTMFLTPEDQVPFVGGTYFPPEPRHGLPAFRDLLQRVSRYYQHHPAELRQQNQALLAALHHETTAETPAAGALDAAPLQASREQMLRHFDPMHGGFGSAPKFPHPGHLERLLRCGPGDALAQQAALFSLRRMALGGLYDQLGGGFYRYSVDGEWRIPHFEKMLYDNGLLLALYAQAGQCSGDPLLQTVAAQTGDWLLREMQHPEGGFYATLDADSAGEEGRFYLWTPDEVRALLPAEQYAVFAAAYGLDAPANFEGHAWHLHRAQDTAALAQHLGVDEASLEARLAAARQTLCAARAARIWPERDEKIICAWNGLAIRGLAIAGRHLDRADFVAAAERALDFIRAQLWRDGRLRAVYKDGQAPLPAYLDDYAFLIDGILELLHCRWRDGDLDFALALADVLLHGFQDADAGGFYFTAADHETLIQRPKPLYDEALPAGNGVAARVLELLSQITGHLAYRDAAERTLRWAMPTIVRQPMASDALLTALESYLHPGELLILRGDSPELRDWWARVARPYAPRRFTLAIPRTARLSGDLLMARHAGAATVTAYLCRGLDCAPPTSTWTALEAALAAPATQFSAMDDSDRP